MTKVVKSETLGGLEVLTVDVERLKKSLEQIASEIRSTHPEVEEIILFGSFSRGTFTPRSDVDITIIVHHADKRFIERPSVYVDCFSRLDVDSNIIVYTVEEWQRMMEEGNAFVREIDKGLRL